MSADIKTNPGVVEITYPEPPIEETKPMQPLSRSNNPLGPEEIVEMEKMEDRFNEVIQEEGVEAVRFREAPSDEPITTEHQKVLAKKIRKLEHKLNDAREEYAAQK